MTEIYVRDLREDIQAAVVEDIKKSGDKKLIKAMEDGEDILIGDSDDSTVA